MISAEDSSTQTKPSQIVFADFINLIHENKSYTEQEPDVRMESLSICTNERLDSSEKIMP